DPADRAAVEVNLAANPDAAVHLDSVRAAFAPLETDWDVDLPPPLLAERTVARLDALFPELKPQPVSRVNLDSPVPSTNGSSTHRPSHIARHTTTDRPEARSVGGRFRADVIVAAGISLIAVGLVLSFVNRARYANEVVVCQNNLQTLHQGLSGYADTHGGRYPQVGTEAYPTAGWFVQALV